MVCIPCMYTYIYIEIYYVYNEIMCVITTPLSPLFFEGGPYQTVCYIFGDSPLNVNSVAERLTALIFCGDSPQNTSGLYAYLFKGPLKIPWKSSLYFGCIPPPQNDCAFIVYNCIHSCVYTCIHSCVYDCMFLLCI